MGLRVRRRWANRGGLGQDLLGEVNSLERPPQQVLMLSLLLGNSSSPQTRDGQSAARFPEYMT